MKKVSKVYVVTTAHPSTDARIFYREIGSLSHKYQLEYLAPDNKAASSTNVKVVSYPGLSRLQRGVAYFGYLRRQKAKIIHFHDLDFAPFAILLKYLNGAQIIFDKHEFSALTIENRSWAPAPLKPLLGLIFLAMERFFSLFCDYLVVANPRQLDHDRAATLLLNVPPLSIFPPHKAQKDYKKVCYIGDITKARGADNLLALSKILPGEFRLLLVGNIRDNQVREQINSANNIEWSGFLPLAELDKSLKDVGIGLVPFLDREQYHKSIPSKIFDYMAMGMSVVSFDFVRESLGKVVDVGQAVTFVSPSVEAMVDTIIRQAKEGAKGGLGRKLFEERYNWEQEEKKLFELYAEVVGNVR